MESSPELSFMNCYGIQDAIESGGWGTVYHCIRRQDGLECAAKVIDLTEDREVGEGLTLRQITLREVEILKIVAGHKNVIQLLDVYDLQTEIVMIFEYCPNGDLCTYWDENGEFLTEAEVLRILGQVLEAVQHCHRLGVVHRDIKLENILIDGDLNVKLCDFGLSRQVKPGEHLNYFCGTRGFMAPEMLLGATEHHSAEGYSFEVDEWACGVLLYRLLTNHEPFRCGDQEVETLLTLRGVSVDGPAWDKISKAAKDIIAGFLTLDPKERLTAERALQLPVFGGTPPPARDQQEMACGKELQALRRPTPKKVMRPPPGFEHAPRVKFPPPGFEWPLPRPSLRLPPPPGFGPAPPMAGHVRIPPPPPMGVIPTLPGRDGEAFRMRGLPPGFEHIQPSPGFTPLPFVPECAVCRVTRYPPPGFI